MKRLPVATLVACFIQIPTLTLTSPSVFQVFQRDTTNTGAIHIQGTVWNAPFYTLSAQWGSFDSGVLYSGTNASFDVTWDNLPAGQHALTVTVNNEVVTVEYVGIGDVYLIAGQSNAVGAGVHEQMYMNTLGLRAGMFNVTGWHELADPVGNEPFDNITAGGSQWPLLASYILEQGVPVAFIPCAVSGTRVSMWLADGKYYANVYALLARLPVPSVRAVLWQQGESDALAHTPPDSYAHDLIKVLESFYADTQSPAFVARLWRGYVNANLGIDIVLDNHPEYVFAGADLTALAPDNGAHYTTDANLAREAWLWWTALVKAGFYEDSRIR